MLADRLYTSSMKILASVRSRQDHARSLASTPDYLDVSETASRLLVPISHTPTLDYLEQALKGRTKYLNKLIATYRALVAGSTRNGTGTSTSHHNGDFMTKLLKVKYLRTGSNTPASKDKRRAAVNMAIERLEQALSLGKHEAALVLADLYLVRTSSLGLRL